MQTYDKKPEVVPWKPKKKVETKQPEVAEAKINKVEPKEVTSSQADIDSKSTKRTKSSTAESHELLSGVGSALGGIGAFIASSSHTAATACRMASTNPVLMGVGIVLVIIGFGAALYFKYFQ